MTKDDITPGNSMDWNFDTYDLYVQAKFTSMEMATTVALTEAKDARKEHNGLIDKMEKQSATFITRKEFYAAVFGVVSFTTLIVALMKTFGP